MSRLRARLARSPLDREVQGLVAQAQRSVQAALGVAERGRRRHRSASTESGALRRELQRLLGSLDRVRMVTPTYTDEGDSPREEEAVRHLFLAEALAQEAERCLVAAREQLRLGLREADQVSEDQGNKARRASYVIQDLQSALRQFRLVTGERSRPEDLEDPEAVRQARQVPRRLPPQEQAAATNEAG